MSRLIAGRMLLIISIRTLEFTAESRALDGRFEPSDAFHSASLGASYDAYAMMRRLR